MSGEHWLTVHEEWNEDDDGLEVEHVGCPKVDVMEGVWDWDCGVSFEMHNSGLRYFFAHRDDPDDVLDAYVERLAPGRYPIEQWSETYRSMEGTEYDGGLRTVEP